MGRQVRFFLSELEERMLIKIITDNSDILVTNKSERVNDDELPRLSQRILYITSRDSIIIKGQSGFIDPIQSEVIEFSRCISHNKSMQYGRLWIETKFYASDSKLISKNKLFFDKFNMYKKWIVKYCKLSKNKDFYIGEEALKLHCLENYKMMASPKYEVDFSNLS